MYFESGMAKNIFDNTEVAFQSKSTTQLKKAYNLFRLIQNPTLTRLGNQMNSILMKIRFPFIKSIIRSTIYEQFVGGESLDDSLPTVYDLYKFHIFSILDYSVEGKINEESFEKTYQEVLENIRWAKEKEEIPFVVFKPTGIGSIKLYEKVGAQKELNTSEKEAWQRVLNRFDSLAQTAEKNNVPLMVDAEESWMQDAADTIIENLMKRYNQNKVIVCNTLQMYRIDRLDYLKKQLSIAEKENYQLGFKIVRGAYMDKERERAEEMGYLSPIHVTKQNTDDDYNEAIAFCLKNNPRIAIYAGTHNEQSCLIAIDQMKALSIAPNHYRVWFGQLFGMSDNLSYNLADRGYNIAKYVPYGPVEDVVPYLSRRASENTAMAGQTGRELSLIRKEIERRKKLA